MFNARDPESLSDEDENQEEEDNVADLLKLADELDESSRLSYMHSKINRAS